jgi:hypothetical protein
VYLVDNIAKEEGARAHHVYMYGFPGADDDVLFPDRRMAKRDS